MRKNFIAVMVLGLMIFASTIANAQVFASFVDESDSSWTGMYGGLHMGHGWGDLGDSLQCDGLEESVHSFGDSSLFGSISFNSFIGGTQTTACDNPDLHPTINFPLGGHPQAFTAVNRDDDFADLWTNHGNMSDIDGWMGGVQLGFLYQISKIVVGMEVSGSVTNMSDTRVVEVRLIAVDLDTIFEFKTDINFLMTSVVRAGFSVTPDLLVSVKGGLAFAQIDFESSSEWKDSNTVEGWTVGGQVDLRLTKNTSAFISYDHSEFDDIKFRTEADFLIFHTTTYHEYDYDIDQIKFGINYHF